ncbi:phospho-sugar mutase [Clostridium perfringens]|uniref:Phosphoglucomutase n=1 Tax=Clostridium perfringens TaxID=1502 RepID=A0AAW9ILI4_CLOPF|nr:phospho-sugar mutase [Clostridium perfringens]EHK2344456.1 phospho-sugar mutase [Clostridium perfringens]EIF6166778.1 phospho-sugar mutase [Clostridium perfringens]ELC8412153.1 phospho-sugar mutase [Clostridium perfringens]ELC8464417.1 phospho-sugar mutase [Clostridium perfringens]MCX0350968.1 phospho-sugar mutase [Clostridium perfringens]
MYREKYEEWLNSDIISEEIKAELRDVKEDKEIEDRFYKELDFGTGGLRGVIGAGTNRMNIYTVGKATQGFADYLNDNYAGEKSVAIAYDSRNMSKEFAKAAALTLCANGIKVNLFESLRPTPMLSFAVRELNCKGGIVITASHNPKQYNGYKVYGDDGCQLTDAPAKAVIGYVNKVTDYANIKTMSEEKALEEGLLVYIGEEIDKKYIDDLKTLTIREDLVKKHAKDLKIIYTPIHGSGNVPVRRILKELGYENLFVVKEQEMPDGNFPTAPYPNPEDPKVFKLALDMAKEIQPDIIFGTDPDCDRIGVVVKDNNGEYQVLSGNQTGMLLTNYILSSLKEMNKLPENGAVIKTIVTTESVRKMTEEYGVTLIDTLTGFKYIGEKIREFEESGSNEYLFGFEESYGYLAGTFARDKDAVVASMLIAEMTLYYKEQGKTLYDGLIELYNKYGYFKESLVSIELAGKEGQEQIAKCIDGLRNDALKEMNGVKVITSFDYKLSKEVNNLTGEEKEIKLPKSNVLKYVLEDDSWFVVRPSGTEPKMKIYLSVKGSSLEDSKEKTENFKNAIMEVINAKLK